MTEYKRPREGVTGTSRTDWLLSLEDEARLHREIIAAQAYQLHGACLVGLTPRRR